MMKRLTSILLALLMLVGMALAEETPDDTLMGNWYGLNAQTIIRLVLKGCDVSPMPSMASELVTSA